jgi:hypothetical protein
MSTLIAAKGAMRTQGGAHVWAPFTAPVYENRSPDARGKARVLRPAAVPPDCGLVGIGTKKQTGPPRQVPERPGMNRHGFQQPALNALV